MSEALGAGGAAGILAALLLALAACSRTADTATAVPPRENSTYTLMQMNLCLSGFAGCYRRVAYPAGLDDAVDRIRDEHPDAITLNEACGGDASLIARKTGYHLRFAQVIYNGKPLRCIKPGGRGLFGDAVLTRAAIQSGETAAFKTQGGPERRGWLCVRTRIGVEVCTAHLASQERDEIGTNAPQCAELKALLARRAESQAIIFGGDVNRRPSCAPRGWWTLTDRFAGQDPGSQHVYGTGALRLPSAHVLPAGHTDHDVLLVRAHF